MRTVQSKVLKLNIQGQPTTVFLKIQQSDAVLTLPKDRRLTFWVSASTDRGTNLVHLLDLKDHFDLDKYGKAKRMRSLQKVLQTMVAESEALLNSFAEYLESHQDNIRLFRQIVRFKPFSCGQEGRVEGVAGVRHLNMSNVNSAYQPKNMSCVSWYDHGLSNKVNYLICTLDTDRTIANRFELPDSMLYNLERVKELSESESFKTKRLAFFNYDKVEQLLKGTTNGSGGVCGLFAS